MVVIIKIINSRSHNPIEDVKVCLDQQGRHVEAATDGEGSVRFSGLPEGKWKVKVRHKDYRPYTKNHIFKDNTETVIQIQKAWAWSA